MIRKNGRPDEYKLALISMYDTLDLWLDNNDEFEGWLYGDDILIYLTSTYKLAVKGLKHQKIDIQIKNNLSLNDITNTEIRDVTINGVELFDLITTFDWNKKM